MSGSGKLRLLGAAKSCFAKYGFRGASVSAIARAAGVTPAMVNHHFGNKRGLYDACIASFSRKRSEAIERLVVPSESPDVFRLRLELLLEEMLELHLADLDMVRILMRDADDPELMPPDADRAVLAFSEHLVRLFVLGQEGGVIRADIDPAAPALLLYHSLAARLQVDAHRQRAEGKSLADPVVRRAHLSSILDVVLHGVVSSG